MQQLLQQFESPIADRGGELYDVYLYGRGRIGDTWQGWLVFERRSDRQRFQTGVETTQSNAEAVLYWATGLTDAYFDGALERAMSPRTATEPIPQPPPVVGASSEIRRERLAALEREILQCFSRHRVTRMLTERLLNELPHAHADVIRALEDMEKQGRWLLRRTDDGNDWLFLTDSGAREAGVPAVSASPQPSTRVR